MTGNLEVNTQGKPCARKPARTVWKGSERTGRKTVPRSQTTLHELAARGSFLLDEPHSEWAKKRRREVQDHLRQSVHALARLYLSRYGEAAEEEVLRILIAYRRSHPTDEDLVRPLLHLLAKRGRYNEVLDYYEALERSLAARGLTKAGTVRTPHRLTSEIVDYVRLKLREGIATTSAQEERFPYAFLLGTPREQEERVWQQGNDTRNLLSERQSAQVATGVHPFLVLPSHATKLSTNQQDRAVALFIPSIASNLSRGDVLALPISTTQHGTSGEMITPDCATQFGLILARVMTLIEHWYGMALFCHELQDQLDHTIKGLDSWKSHYTLDEYAFSRRSFLMTLAALPAATLTSSQQAYKLVLNLEELLPRCAASITACWHLSVGNHLEIIAPMIDSFLPTLITAIKQVPSYREVVADLVAQCYFLKTILAWHVEGLERAEGYCHQALYYSEMTNDLNLRLTALNQHALIAYYGKQFQKALVKSGAAFMLLENAPQGQIFPIVQGRVCMYLAAIQAQQGQGHAEQTLERAQKAFALQASLATPVPLYADCGEAPLTLWDGLTHYHLSQKHSTHARRALDALRRFGQLQPSTKIPERFRLECLNNRTLAAIQCDEMEEALLCLETGKQGALALESKQRHTEVAYASQQMLRQWPNEPKVQKLNSSSDS